MPDAGVPAIPAVFGLRAVILPSRNAAFLENLTESSQAREAACTGRNL